MLSLYRSAGGTAKQFLIVVVLRKCRTISAGVAMVLIRRSRDCFHCLFNLKNIERVRMSSRSICKTERKIGNETRFTKVRRTKIVAAIADATLGQLAGGPNTSRHLGPFFPSKTELKHI